MCSKTRTGKFTVRRKTIAKRLRKKLQDIKAALRERMHWPIPQQGAWLRSVLLGHYRYYAVPRNGSLLKVFRKGSGAIGVGRSAAVVSGTGDLAAHVGPCGAMASVPPYSASVSCATPARHDPRQDPVR